MSEPRTIRRLISLKLVAFIIYVFLLTGFVWAVSMIAPEAVVTQGMWMITYLALLLVGGQAAIDALVPVLSKLADAFIAWKSPKP